MTATLSASVHATESPLSNRADFSQLPGRGIKPLVSLRAHPRLALIVFALIFLAGIPVAFIKGKPQYATTATVQVAPSYMKNLRDDGELSFPSNTQYREFLEQQAKSILRYDIVQDALRGLGPLTSRWQKGNESERAAIDRLRAQMAIRVIPDTYMIEVSLQNGSKDALSELVNAVVNTYVERMRVERIFGADVRVRNLESRETELVKLILQKTQKRTALALQLGIAAFSGKEENPYDRVLADLRAALADARNKHFDAQAKLDAFQRRGETDITTRSIQEAVLIDPGLANLKSNLFKRRADLLTQLSGLRADHPGITDIQKELANIDTELANKTTTLSDSVRGSLLARYQATADQTGQVENDLQNEFSEQEKRGATFADLYNRAMTLTQDIDQDRKELETIRDRLNQLTAEQNSFGFVRMVSPALPPEMPFGPGKKKILLMVIAAALLAAAIAPIGRDLLDRRVHTLNDAERILGVPALGWMVEQSDDATKLFGEDLLRRIAGGLLREQNAHGTHVFAFSAVKPGAGSSKLVQDLGRVLTALGYPALVVEANAFKPDVNLHSETPGLAQALALTATADECITPATTTAPARVWVGSTDGNRHLDRLDRLTELTVAWSEQYPFVLVDAPPLLLSADAEIIAGTLEHLILVVEAGGISAGELRRCGRLIEKVAPTAVGVVVNRIRPFEGGGYLRDVLIEYLTGRKSADYHTQPAWHLDVLARLNTVLSWRPRRLRAKH